MFFVEKDDEATRDAIRGHKVSQMSKEKAIFVLVVKPIEVEPPTTERRGPTITSGGGKKADEGDKAAETAEPSGTPFSAVPQSRFLAGDLWKAYDVKTAGTVIAADWFGNSKQTWSRAPRESEVIRTVETIPALVERDAKVLASDLQRLEGYVEKNDHSRAVSQAVKMFKRDLAGHEAVTKAAEHWTKLMDEGRQSISSLESQNDVIGLRRLRGTYRGTDIESELNRAIERVSAVASK